MSDLLEAGAVSNDLKYTICSSNVINNSHKRILRSKENLFKPKCNKELKKKLKKYKLRRDGNEDQDIIDVSRILVNSLRIKSPNNVDKINTNNNKVDSEHQEPNNYLFKMVRRKKASSQTETNNVNKSTPQAICIFDEESQTTKQMDAFKLMMDSRNKSIGTNSPGKEKNADETITQDIVEKKAIKAKRVLSLQKMAESKGSLKKKEIEEYRENCIQKKMLKRAELFKDMITKPDSKIDKKEHLPKSNNNSSETKPNKEISNQQNSLKQNNKTLKLCDLFSDTNTIINESKPSERVSDEDIEFLKKLSPSIRRKENMLCYFRKVSKDMELTSEEIENNCSSENTNSVIKVKFTPKRKKKSKVLKSNEDDLVSMSDSKSNETKNLTSSDSNNLDNMEQMENNERRKRKRNKKPEENVSKVTKETKDNDNMEPCNNENRPKRNTKKPVKYTEDVHCFSSDEELHIFTPKKKRSSENCSKVKAITIVKDADSKISRKEMSLNNKDNEVSLKLPNQLKTSNNCFPKQNNKMKLELKKDLKNTKTYNGLSKKLFSKVKHDDKTVKLAPIFVSKPQISQEAIEAKQRFLKSGAPEKLKKSSMTLQTNNFTFSDNFHPVFHVHQNDTHLSNLGKEGKDWFNLTSNELEEINTVSNFSYKSLLMTMPAESFNFPFSQLKPEKVLKCIKSAYPKFPVYRTYHKLRSKCKGDFKDFNYTDLDNSIDIIDDCTEVNNDNPEKLNWCDKYKPTSSNQIIGNFGSIKELKRWLESWSEKLIKDKINDSDDPSDMSDFYSSDMDSRDAMKSTNNVLIVTGQTGSGKTSSVYAIAAELAIKVIEVNASSKRNGKIMLQDLQEATQSHKVNRAKSSTESSQKSSQSQEVPTLTNSKKRGRPKKAVNNGNIKKNTLTPTPESQSSSSQEGLRTGMSLILIDDADIVFDQDDGFCSAISQLIQSSKRPVILVTSSPSCPHLQKFFQNGKTVHMRPLLPRMLGTWLDIMCLADIGKCCMGLGEKLLDIYKGDIRRTINCLQFYMNSYKSINHTDEVVNSQMKLNIDDECSSMSWADSDSLDVPPSNEIALHSNIYKKLQLFSSHSLSNLFNIWWNLSSNFKIMNIKDVKHYSKQPEKNKEIIKIAECLDTLSIIDCIDHIKPDTRPNITSTPWYCNESASLLESEDFDGYNEAHCISKEISNELITSSISEVEVFFKTEKSVSYLAPSTSTYRERDSIVSRHHTLSSYLNPSATLDRRATALDYWSSCRTICRLEKNKTDYNMKRNNRFCHYLKSLNILCKNDFFDNLADSLN